ncbi:MAG: response regulator [Minisyncoccia bacterium]
MSKILLVDDDKLIRDIYSRKFKDAGFDFFELPDAENNFVKKVVEINPDVILMDINLGGNKTDGAFSAEKLQENSQTKNIPIIFFTNADLDDSTEKARENKSGIGFLIKSEYTPEEIISKVQELYTKHLQSKNIIA